MIAVLAMLAVMGTADSVGAGMVRAADSAHIAPGSELFQEPFGMHARAEHDSAVPRPRAIAISDSYGWKFRTHRIGGYLIIPLFAAQYGLGSELLQQKEDVYLGRRRERINSTLRTAHLATAIGVGTVFLVNSATGAMLLYENRADEHNRAIRIAHTLMMLTADAGFVATGVMGRRAVEETPAYARRHRQIAFGSMGVAAAGAAMMWIFNR